MDLIEYPNVEQVKKEIDVELERLINSYGETPFLTILKESLEGYAPMPEDSTPEYREEVSKLALANYTMLEGYIGNPDYAEMAPILKLYQKLVITHV